MINKTKTNGQQDAAVQEEIKNDIDPDIKNLFDALNKIIKKYSEGEK